MMRFRTVLLLAAAIGLAACEGENKGNDQRTAVGEILPGSASDAMVPYDALRSQPPLAPSAGATGSGKAKGASGAEDSSTETAGEDSGVSDGAAPAEPAEVPTPETEEE